MHRKQKTVLNVHIIARTIDTINTLAPTAKINCHVFLTLYFNDLEIKSVQRHHTEDGCYPLVECHFVGWCQMSSLNKRMG
jgi:hypothetical protein